jgi:hypothetical protein
MASRAWNFTAKSLRREGSQRNMLSAPLRLSAFAVNCSSDFLSRWGLSIMNHFSISFRLILLKNSGVMPR